VQKENNEKIKMKNKPRSKDKYRIGFNISFKKNPGKVRVVKQK